LKNTETQKNFKLFFLISYATIAIAVQKYYFVIKEIFMKKDLKKLLILLSSSMMLGACTKEKVEQEETIVEITTDCYSLEDIVVLDCESLAWYTNKPSGAETLYGKKLFIKNHELNELMNSTYFYKGLFEDESAFLGENYTSIQDENSFVHSYDFNTLSTLEEALESCGLEEFIKSSYSNAELLEINRQLTILSSKLSISRELHK